MFRNDDFSKSAVPKITRFRYCYAAFTEHSPLNCPRQWLNDMRKCPTISLYAHAAHARLTISKVEGPSLTETLPY